MTIVVGITGASGSGKTTIAEATAKALAVPSYVLAEDCFYHDLGKRPGFDPFQQNFDTPESKDYGSLADCLAAFRGGQATTHPFYDFSVHARTSETHALDPKAIDVLIVEGIHALWDEKVRACFDLMVFVDTPLDECLARRIKRDIAERGRDVNEVLWRYRSHVRPGYLQFTLPMKAHADLVITDVPDANDLYIPVLTAINQRLAAKG